MKHPEGIKGLKGRPPYGCAVSMGRKAKGGRGVVEKDQFHLVSNFEDSDHVRPYLAEFQPFHDRPPEKRRLLKGMLVYPRLEQSITYRLSMQAFPRGYPEPHARHHMIPVCEGDGENAIRWKQDEANPDEMFKIKGCGDLCEFRSTDPPPCKPYSKIAFMLQWDHEGAPTPLAKLETRGKGSTRNIKGFIEYLEGVAAEAGIASPNWMGLHFSLRLVQKTNPQKRRKWYEIVLSPESDLIDFLRWQHDRMAALRESLPLQAIPDLRDRPDDVVYEDIQKVTVGDENDS